MAGTRTGQCAECWRRLRLCKDGMVWNHTDKRKATNLPFGELCKGAGKPPRPGTAAWVEPIRPPGAQGVRTDLRGDLDYGRDA